MPQCSILIPAGFLPGSQSRYKSCNICHNWCTFPHWSGPQLARLHSARQMFPGIAMLFQLHPRKWAVNYLQCSTWNNSLIMNICPHFPILSAHNIVLIDALSAMVSLLDFERNAICTRSLEMLATDCGDDSVVKAPALPTWGSKFGSPTYT